MPDEPVIPAAPAAPAAPAGGDVHGACPVCRSPIFVEGGVVKGGGASEYFQELTNKAASAEEWRTKCAALEADRPPVPAPAPAPEPEEEGESFF
jgi:hypothetical protein